jgi:hypothetical protein
MPIPLQVTCTDNETLELAALLEGVALTQQVVVFELLVPDAAQVPAPDYSTELNNRLKRRGPATSTVGGHVRTVLAANNTAYTANWCFTATIEAPKHALR